MKQQDLFKVWIALSWLFWKIDKEMHANKYPENHKKTIKSLITFSSKHPHTHLIQK